MVTLAVGVVAYIAALIATCPASVVAPAGSAAGGTLWHGSAALMGGGSGGRGIGATVTWDASLAASLAAGGLAARIAFDGPATALTGTARWRPFARRDAIDVTGTAGWGMLVALAPGLSPDCTIPLDVTLTRVAAGDVRGTVRSAAGRCAPVGGPARTVPRLLATFAGSSGRVTTWGDRATTLASVDLGDKRVRLDLTAAGAAVLPGPGRPGAIEFDL